MARRQYGSVTVAILCLASAAPAFGQVGDKLSAYTGGNATGYLAPLVDALRTNLNSGLFHSARVPVSGFNASLELNVMSTFFGEGSRTFMATTEGSFSPEKTVEAPTVVGDTDAVIVHGDASTQFAFPGGFDLDRVYFFAPQLSVGSWKGTEVIGRVLLYDTGFSEIGRLSMWGAGVRHNLSQYIARLAPVDMALGAYWQELELEAVDAQHVVDSRVATASLQSGIALGAFYPYAGLSASWFHMDLSYSFEDFGELEPINLEFRSDASFQLTLGVSYQVGFMAAFGEYNLADQSTVAAGLSVNFPFSRRSVTQ